MSVAAADADQAIAFAARLAGCAAEALDGLLVSVILHGSLVLGDYRVGSSDVDLLAVIERALDQAEMDTLIGTVLAETGGAVGRLDFRVVTRGVAANPPPHPPLELYLGVDRYDEPAVVRNHPDEPDLLVEFSLCRQSGRVLIGASVGEVIGEVPDRWIVRVGEAQLARWQGLADDARNAVLMVLTACRIWHFAALGRHCSKEAAGRWALARDRSLEGIALALRARAGEPVVIEPAKVARVVAAVRAQLRR